MIFSAISLWNDVVLARQPPQDSFRTHAVAGQGTSSTCSPRAASHCPRWRPEAAGVLHRPPPDLEPSCSARQLPIPGEGGLDLQRGNYPVRAQLERAGGMGPLVPI